MSSIHRKSKALSASQQVEAPTQLPGKIEGQVLAALTASPECCESTSPFASSGCQYEDLVAAVLPNVGVEKQGLISTLNLLKTACAEDASVNFDVQSC